MDPLQVLAEAHELFLLEDAAQAHGARYRGRRCGSLGDAAAFSFYPTKNLGALGDAGAVVSPGETLARDVRRLGNYGAEQRDHHVVKGVNSRLDPVQAAVLSAKLPQLDSWNERRRALAERYRAGLDDCGELVLPMPRSWAEPVWHVFSVRVRNGQRDALKAHLEVSGIGCNIHYPRPIHLQAAYRDLGLRQGEFPVTEQLASESLSLPLDHFHHSAEIDRVIDGVRKFFRPA
jgi:dTDP-4-amino-4,6-dideoxygalactose transaminase